MDNTFEQDFQSANVDSYQNLLFILCFKFLHFLVMNDKNMNGIMISLKEIEITLTIAL